MRSWNPQNERASLEQKLTSGNLCFSAAYMTVNSLSSLMQKHPEIARSQLVLALKDLLVKPTYISQTQSYFLYKAAAEVLIFLLLSSTDKSLIRMIGSLLKGVVGKATSNQHRAASEALGTLPLKIHGPKIETDTTGNLPKVKWENVLKRSGLSVTGAPRIFGRSIISTTHGGKRILVIKLAFDQESLELIHNESLWMQYFTKNCFVFPMRFDIPEPLTIDGDFVFRISNLPVSPKIWPKSFLSSGYYAIAFAAPKDYFSYPNDPALVKQNIHEKICDIIFRNAWLFGKLTSMGIVHAAPIPLFHNRTQRRRREDYGIYEWSRGGRLDRWLESCRYPNFCITGVRDFEHFLTVSEPCKNLYQFIGTHILSLLLVSASTFRNKDPEQFGYDKGGNPVDARSLFDKPLLEKMVRGIFYKYYEGFTGKAFQGEEPVSFDQLTGRMVEEMGVDRHMEEVLRVADQIEMTDENFRAFLRETGRFENEIQGMRRGEEDITVFSGPHLGAFNDRISLPELTRFIEAASALCIAGRYEKENNLLKNGPT
jgi:hypothetical protein